MAVLGWEYNYEDVVKSMKESIEAFEMSFQQAWDYEVENGPKLYHVTVFEIMTKEGKTLKDLFLEIESLEILTNENFYLCEHSHEVGEILHDIQTGRKLSSQI